MVSVNSWHMPFMGCEGEEPAVDVPKLDGQDLEQEVANLMDGEVSWYTYWVVDVFEVWHEVWQGGGECQLTHQKQ